MQGETRGQVAERLAHLLARRAEGLGRGQQGAARHRAARPVEADRGPRQGRDRARHQRGAAEGPDHELQPLLRDLRRRAGQPDARRCRARADARDRASASLHEPERRAARARGLRARPHPGRARRRPRRSPPSRPGSTQAEQLFSQPEAGRLLADLQPATADLASVVEQLIRPVQPDQPLQPMLQRRDPAGRRHGVCRTASALPACANSRSSGTRWSASPSEAQGFDGNGTYVRTATGGGRHR